MASKMALIALLTFLIAIWDAEARFGSFGSGGFRGTSFGGARSGHFGSGSYHPSPRTYPSYGGSYSGSSDSYSGTSGSSQQKTGSSGSSFPSDTLSFGAGMMLGHAMNSNNAHYYRRDIPPEITTPKPENYTTVNPWTNVGFYDQPAVTVKVIEVDTTTIVPSTTTTIEPENVFPIIYPDKILDSPVSDATPINTISADAILSTSVQESSSTSTTTEVPKVMFTSSSDSTTTTSTQVPVTDTSTSTPLSTSTVYTTTIVTSTMAKLPFVNNDPVITDKAIEEECSVLFQNAGLNNGEYIDGRYYFYNDWSGEVNFDAETFVETGPLGFLVRFTTSAPFHPKQNIEKRDLPIVSTNTTELVVNSAQTQTLQPITTPAPVTIGLMGSRKGQLLANDNVASTDPYVRNFYKVLKTKIEKKIKSADRENAKLDSTFFKELNEMKFCFRLYVKKNVIEAKQKALLIY